MEAEAAQIDAGEFRAGQRREWGQAAAGWRTWQDTLFEGTRPVSRRLVELARVEPGDRVLDVAAGAGEPSLTAAAVVGGDGRIVATDLTPEMLAVARERAAAAGLKNVEFVASAAADLEFPPETFDAAVSRWGIIFEPDAEAAARRVRGFLKPGAWMAISAWGPPDQVPMIALPMRSVMMRLNVPPPPPATPGPFARPTHDALAGLLARAGFADVEVDDVDVAMVWESVDEFRRFSQDVAAGANAILDRHPPEVRDEVWAAVAEAASAFAAADGTLRLTNRALVAAGRV